MTADGSTGDVLSLYRRFPYPSPTSGDGLIHDIASLVQLLFAPDTLEGKTLLDAGCGTGHRLVGLARRFPRASVLGIDMTDASLDVCRQLAQKHNAANVRLERHNLLAFSSSQKFDVITSTGVIVTMEDPERGLRNLCECLAPDGVIILWLYHSLGEWSRMLQRELLFCLWGDDRSDLDVGYDLMRDLGFQLEGNRYGSTASQKRSELSQSSIDVDAYMHPIVWTYRFNEALALVQRCGVDWAAISGFNAVGVSKLIDLDEVSTGDLAPFCLTSRELFPAEGLRERYRRMSKADRLRAIELMTRPTGITLVAGRGASLDRLGARIRGNVVG